MENENKIANSENSSPAISENKGNDLATLTDQNWLFINAFLQTGNILKSYKIAGYRGEDRSAPYQLFKQLKARIEDLGNLDVTSRARLQADLKQVLDLPLAANKKELTISEWLRVRKFAAAITPEATQAKPQISVLVINRSAKSDGGVANGDRPMAKGNNTPTDPSHKDVIDLAPIIE